MNPIFVLLVLFVCCSYSQDNGLDGNIGLTEGTIQERAPPASGADLDVNLNGTSSAKEITCKDVFGNVRLLCHDGCFEIFDLTKNIDKCTDKVCDYSINKVYKDLDEGTLMLKKKQTTSCKDKLEFVKDLCQKQCSKVFDGLGRKVVLKCQINVCTHMVKHGNHFANQQD